MKHLYFLCLIIFIACAHQTRQEQINRKIKKLKVVSSDFWQTWKSDKLEDKIYPLAPQDIIEYLELMNKRDGFKEKPQVAQLDHIRMNEMINGLKILPPQIKKIINPQLTAIFFVKDLGGSAIVMGIHDSKGKEVSSVAIFDVDALDKTANEWCSWKESTPFTPAEGYRLKCTIENYPNNNRGSAFRYIFLHEMGHVILKEYKLDFPWDRYATSQADIDEYEFSKISWRYLAPFNGNPKEHMGSAFDQLFSLRKDVVYYKPPAKLDMTKASDSYQQLAQTNFTTMYGATNYNDDLADSVANYIHVVLMKRPFSIQILKNQKVIYTYHDCWNEQRCQEKKQILAKYLK